jgi:hypothetical protein
MDVKFRSREILYPIKESTRTRDRPLQVIALGLSRSGTQSLSFALRQLGYDDVYHGLQLVEGRTEDIPQWYRLTKAKQHNDKAFLCKEEFDKVLGNCMAVTDMPCCSFGPELMDAYPDAKVVLNRRADTAAWEKSIRSTLMGMLSTWWAQVLLWFDKDLCWRGLLNSEVFEAMVVNPLLQAEGGMQAGYEKYYKDMEQLCREKGRECIVWGPEQGWNPLCDFLGHEKPKTDFPRGNTPADIMKFAERVHGPRVKRAVRNISVIFGGFGLIMYFTCRR